jgi:hypothetical protein
MISNKKAISGIVLFNMVAKRMHTPFVLIVAFSARKLENYEHWQRNAPGSAVCSPNTTNKSLIICQPN